MYLVRSCHSVLFFSLCQLLCNIVTYVTSVTVSAVSVSHCETFKYQFSEWILLYIYITS